MKIPKLIMQTSKFYDGNAARILLKSFPGWEYEHFDDQQCIDYMTNNKIDGIENPIEKYLQYRLGAHRADFFRYYYLYLNGGGFIDSDLMIYKNIDHYLSEYEFVSVNSLACPGHMFQGFLFVTKNNKIILEALWEMYTSSYKKMQLINGGTDEGYLVITKDLDNIVKKNKTDNILLFEESPTFYYMSENSSQRYEANAIGTKNDWFGVHWQQEKVVHNYSKAKKSLVYL
jgi:hypothetical protein